MNDEHRPLLGAAIRRARLKVDMSQRQLAAKLSLSAGMVSQLETDQSLPSVRTLLAISRVLNVSLDDLFHADSPDSHPELDGGLTAVDRSSREIVENHVGNHTVPASGSSRPERSAPIRLQDRIMSADRRPTISMAGGVTWHLLTSDQNHPVLFMMVSYPAGAETTAHGEFVRHPDTEYFVMLDGELEINIEFESMTVRAGDSMWFDSSRPHRFRNTTDTTARGVWVLVPQ